MPKPTKPTYEELEKAFRDAMAHLEYCGYGDKWERECARDSGLIADLDGTLKALDNPALSGGAKAGAK